jgi:hypothetical protein
MEELVKIRLVGNHKDGLEAIDPESEKSIGKVQKIQLMHDEEVGLVAQLELLNPEVEFETHALVFKKPAFLALADKLHNLSDFHARRHESENRHPADQYLAIHLSRVADELDEILEKAEEALEREMRAYGQERTAEETNGTENSSGESRQAENQQGRAEA